MAAKIESRLLSLTRDLNITFAFSPSFDMELYQERVEGTYPFPELTTYVTIKLDIVGSVASEQLEDDEIIAKAAKVLPKTYVGYVTHVGLLLHS